MYDLIVIGSGPAGEKGAAQTADLGKRWALIEREAVSGAACVNTGTIPSKTLRESALHLSGFRHHYGETVDAAVKPDLTVRDFMHRTQVVIEKEWERIDRKLRPHKVGHFQGVASVRCARETAVHGKDGEQLLETAVVLIATGSSPYRPPHVPFDDTAICDSDTI